MRQHLFLLILAIGMIASLRAVAEPKHSQPNFVVIFIDDMGYGDLGCFGNTQIRTPRIDQMANEGMKFTSFYAQHICGPSRAALMTGCYPMRVAERNNIKNVHPILHSKEITVAEILKSVGYTTGAFGKWDLAKHSQRQFHKDLMPNHQGFDYFFGTPSSNDGYVDLYRNEKRIQEKAPMATLTERYTDEAISFIQKHQAKPFFVYVPHTMPHTRLAASSKFKGKSKRGLYGDVIEEIDYNVGRILDELKRLELATKTYVLLTSDNGPWLIKNKDRADGHLPRDHGGTAGILRSGKVSTWEGGMRVPTVLWKPGTVLSGAVCDKIASTLDVLPTFAKLAGAKTPKDRVIDGEDITHLFHGQFGKANPDKTYYYYQLMNLQAVRQGKWKLHLPRPDRAPWLGPFANNRHIAAQDAKGFMKPFLVDLHKDIGESRNVADTNPKVVAHLMKLAEMAREDIGDYDRVGKNMRFYDKMDKRPEKPPVAWKPYQPKPSKK